MWILSVVAVILITLRGYKFLPKYIIIRKKRQFCDAVMMSFKPSKGSFGVIPKLSYIIDSVEYKMITPISSSFVTVDNPVVGNEIVIYYNPKKPSECVMKADFKVLAQILITIFVYCISIYMIMHPYS